MIETGLESDVESTVGTWSVPECPYRIEYSPRVLDDIRLSVVDAFFSLPRGGAEIGGILLGTFGDGRISITAYRALDCEHATGPSFTLSQNDQAQLTDLLAAARHDPGGPQPIGWYHSHTRSDIFLSDADKDIHNRFFPEKWQVALVLKPGTFEPTRGGFFFREPDGSIRGSASYREFEIEALPLRQVPAGNAPQMPPTQQSMGHESVIGGTVINQISQPQPEARPERVPEPPPNREAPASQPAAVSAPREKPAAEEPKQPVDLPAPQFLQIKPERSWRWLKVVAAVALGVGLCAGAYRTRQAWLPTVKQRVTPLMARIRPGLPKEAPPTLSLRAGDDNGQLRIQWDGKSPVIGKAGRGVLEIVDGSTPVQSVALDRQHLEAGAFTYSRQAERVEVRLSVGDGAKENVSFLGKLPEHTLPAEDPAIRKERDELRQEAAKLKQDLDVQAAKTRKLEQALNGVKEQLARESQRRLSNQLAEPPKR